MSYKRVQVAFPLYDGNDTVALEAVSGLLRHKIVGTTLFSDNFNDNALSASWTKTGSLTNETNQRIEGKGNGASWDLNGIITASAYAKITGTEWRFSFTPYDVNDSIAIIGPVTSWSYTGTGCYVNFGYSGGKKFYIGVNGSFVNTGYGWAGGAQYNIRIAYQNPGWKVYVQSDSDANYLTEVQIYSTATNSSGDMKFQAQFYSAAGLSYLDDVLIINPSGYTNNASPTPNVQALPAGSIVYPSSSDILVFKDGAIVADTSTDWKVKYSVDGGAASAFMTLAAFKTLAPQTVNVSFILTPQYNTDGVYRMSSDIHLVMEVDIPDAISGGGITKGRLINTGGF